MDQDEADERYSRLVGNLVAARDLLQSAGAGWWSDWLTTVHAEVSAHDAHGLRRLLGGYGGMGSFNDLVIHPLNGHAVSEADVGRVNTSLDALRSALHADATALLGDLDRRR